MELQLTSATCLKIFIFPTFQNQKSILLSFLSNSLLRSVCFYPLHYFFLCLVKFPGCGDLASWNKLYCCDFEFSIPGNLSFSGFWLGFIFLQFLTGSWDTVGLGPTGMIFPNLSLDWYNPPILFKSPHRIFVPRNSLALWMLKRSVLAARFRLWFGVFGLVWYGTVIWDISLDTGVRIVFFKNQSSTKV